MAKIWDQTNTMGTKYKSKWPRLHNVRGQNMENDGLWMRNDRSQYKVRDQEYMVLGGGEIMMRMFAM